MTGGLAVVPRGRYRQGMIGGCAGTLAGAMGTNGGIGGMNGAQRRLALGFAAGFAVILIAVTIANATSMLSDFAAAGIRETAAHVWTWQITSVVAWVAVIPAIWWMVAVVRPPRFTWPAIALVVAIGSVPASLSHVGLMIGLRKAIYALNGESYRFAGWIADPWMYEFRKDVGTYLQFAAIVAIVQWLIARAATAPAGRSPTLAIVDGTVTHHVPVDEIDWITAAGNYVELRWRDRTLLHRATLSAVEERLGPGFIRIHRGRLVRRAAIRRIETDRSGDFTVTLADGTSLRGSRRYRLDGTTPSGV